MGVANHLLTGMILQVDGAPAPVLDPLQAAVLCLIRQIIHLKGQWVAVLFKMSMEISVSSK